MTDNIVDALQIKIERAKRELPLETVNAIAAVDWKAAILKLRNKFGYNFEQLGDLELETELLLCGLINAKNYPEELEKRMKIPKTAVNELVKEMNISVFNRIREELMKNTERKNGGEDKIDTKEAQVLSSVGIEIIPDLPKASEIQVQAEKLELTTPLESREDILKKIEKPEPVHPILAEKLSGSFQTPTVKTEHTIGNITKTTPSASYPPKKDPYRLSPDE